MSIPETMQIVAGKGNNLHLVFDPQEQSATSSTSGKWYRNLYQCKISYTNIGGKLIFFCSDDPSLRQIYHVKARIVST